MDWNEPTLVERGYRIGPDQIAVTVRLGFPRSTEREDEWACSFQLSGSDDGRVRVARGADGLEALTIAASAIRQWLDDAGSVTSTEIPYEIYSQDLFRLRTAWITTAGFASYWMTKLREKNRNWRLSVLRVNADRLTELSGISSGRNADDEQEAQHAN
jgi:hypothetical protein